MLVSGALAGVAAWLTYGKRPNNAGFGDNPGSDAAGFGRLPKIRPAKLALATAGIDRRRFQVGVAAAIV